MNRYKLLCIGIGIIIVAAIVLTIATPFILMSDNVDPWIKAWLIMGGK